MPPDQSVTGLSNLLRRLSWPALRRLGIHLGGAEQSIVRGPGIEYTDAREYTPGDDSRLIDWNLTARSDRPFVKDSFPERALDAWLVLDVSPSMAWGTARCLKGRLVNEMAVAASELLARSGNRVGVILFGAGQPAIVPPRAGRTHRMRLLASLEAAGTTPEAGTTDLTAALERVERVARRRALVLLVTDFLTAGGWERPLARMSLRHEIVAVHVTDPREHAIPNVGVVTFEDPETGRQLTVDTSSRKLRARFEEAATAQRAQLEERLRRCRVDVLQISTDEELMPRLVHFLATRRALRSARGPRPWDAPAAAIPASTQGAPIR
ncbi:MAG: DUF58 domain-containing protein [Chloroflexi bacterium]|nr:MAG: DUF58 domain-containing protein [Chloroflexota bacterium]